MKRTPLKRRTPLRSAGRALRRVTRLAARRARPRREQPGDRDPKYLALVRQMRCLARDMGTPCRGRTHAHHPRHLSRGAGLKAPDRCVIPLCKWHHVFELHAGAGAFKGWTRDELRAWQDKAVDFTQAIAQVHDRLPGARP